MNSRTLRSGLLVCLLFALSACDFQCSLGGGIDTDKVEKAVSEALTAKAGTTVTVECPDDVKEKKGETFLCKATAEDGSQVDVVVTMRGEGNIDWETKASGPVKMNQERLQTTIAEPLSAKAGLPVQVTCPADVVEEVGGTFTCDAKAQDGSSAVVQVTMRGGGNVDWAVLSSTPAPADGAPSP